MHDLGPEVIRVGNYDAAGASALAATLGPLRQYVAGRTVAILCSGTNLSPAHLRAIAVRPTTGSE